MFIRVCYAFVCLVHGGLANVFAIPNILLKQGAMSTHYKPFCVQHLAIIQKATVPLQIVFSADDNEQGFDLLFLATINQG